METKKNNVNVKNKEVEVNSNIEDEVTVDNNDGNDKVNEYISKDEISDINVKEVSVDNNIDKKDLKKKKIVIASVATATSIIVIYLAVALYFNNRFYFGSEINGVVATGKTVSAMSDEIISQSQTYQLEIVGRDGTNEVISGQDISLEYSLGNEIEVFKTEQNPFNWISGMFNKTEYSLKQDVEYDLDKLKEIVSSSAYFNGDKIIEPENATVEFKDNQYEIVSEIMGNRVNEESFYNAINDAIVNGETVINLDESGCYENPKFLSTSQEVLDAKDTLNKYVATEITYSIGDNTETIDSEIINTWLEVNEEMQPVVNEEKVKGYVQELASKYNTYGNTRTFKSSYGTNVQVQGGDYGWIINKADETAELIANVQAGEPVSREPIYSQKGRQYGMNDIGNTYVEIDLSGQHIWFYKNGSLIVESDIVTGNPGKGWGTPQGTYVLKYKQKDTVLRGDDYASPVSFWMPFNGGIGLHDATWRSSFGGSIFQSSGSHGCVNLPYSVAQKIFNNIESGVPVVCYF